MSNTHAAVGTETQDKTVLATATDQKDVSTEQIDGNKEVAKTAEDATKTQDTAEKALRR
jgi:hypothetical protein